MALLVATVIDRAKGVADKRNDNSIPDADWLTYANWGQLSLWRRITALDPNAYFAEYDFTLAGGAGAGARLALAGTTLPFRALHGLDLNPDTAQRRTIRPRNFRERNMARVGWWDPAPWADDRRYDKRGNNLIITPYEKAAGNYRLYYRHAPYLFTSATDTTAMDVQLEAYDEYVTIMTARYGLQIEESETGPCQGRLLELVQEITDEHEQDDQEAAVIADVEGDEGFSGGWV